MHPVLLSFGPITLYSYGLMVALGFLAGILATLYYAKQEKIPQEYILDAVIYVILASVIGARLFYVIGTWEDYRANPLEIFMLQKGGLVYLGGFLAAAAAAFFYAKKKGITWLKFFDVIAPGAALGYAIGRLGCFFNGCCFGLPTKLPWGIHFPLGALAHSYYPYESLHPTQLYAFFAMLLAFFVLIYLRRFKTYDGFLFYWWVLFYSLYRFVNEFFRFSPIHWLGLTPAQWMVIVAAALAGRELLIHGKKKPGNS